MARDERSRCLGIHGVQEPDRYIVDLCRENACRVKDLRAEVCEFCCLVKRELADWLRVLDEARVVVVHAVDVCPYLDLVGE